MEWYERKELVEAYDKAFLEAYEGSFDYFMDVMEEAIGEILMNSDEGYSKDAYNEIYDQMMISAKDHYRELQSKYSEG